MSEGGRNRDALASWTPNSRLDWQWQSANGASTVSVSAACDSKRGVHGLHRRVRALELGRSSGRGGAPLLPKLPSRDTGLARVDRFGD